MINKILENINEGLISADSEGLINYINPSAEILIGINSKNAVGKNISELIQIKDEKTGSMVDFPFDWVVKNKLPVKNRNHSILISGKKEKAHLSFDITPICSIKDKPDEFLIVLRDVTDSKNELEAASKKLQKADRELEEF